MPGGGRTALRGLLRAYFGKIEPTVSLGEVIERQQLEVAGVLLTHLHIDHVLGLPDVPKGTPIWVGPGEPAADQTFAGLQRRSFRSSDGAALGQAAFPVGHVLVAGADDCIVTREGDRLRAWRVEIG